MDFRIADTFTDSLARLMGEEQKAVETTAFDLQRNSLKSRHTNFRQEAEHGKGDRPPRGRGEESISSGVVLEPA